MRIINVKVPSPGETAFTLTFGEPLLDLLGHLVSGAPPTPGPGPHAERTCLPRGPQPSALDSVTAHNTEDADCPKLGALGGQAGAVRCSKMTEKDTLPNAHSIKKRVSKSPLCRPNEMGLTAGKRAQSCVHGSCLPV